MYKRKENQPHIIAPNAPQTRPPAAIPSFCGVSGKTLAPMIVNCLHTYVYIWTKSSGAFWMYLTSAQSGGTLGGFRWDRHFWRRFSLNHDEIDSFF